MCGTTYSSLQSSNYWRMITDRASQSVIVYTVSDVSCIDRIFTSPALAGAGEVLQLVCLFVCHAMYIMY